MLGIGRRDSSSSLVFAALGVTFLGDFDSKTFGPVSRDGGVPDVLEEVHENLTCHHV